MCALTTLNDKYSSWDLKLWLKIITANYRYRATVFYHGLKNQQLLLSIYDLICEFWSNQALYALSILFYLSNQSHVSAIVRNPTCHELLSSSDRKERKSVDDERCIWNRRSNDERDNLDQILPWIQKRWNEEMFEGQLAHYFKIV